LNNNSGLEALGRHNNFMALKYFLFLGLLFLSLGAFGNSILIPMDALQKDHLKAYGIAYWALTKDIEVDWLLNYRGGSFMTQSLPSIQNECKVRNISFEVISDAASNIIKEEVENTGTNMDLVKLQKAPKIAVYTPKNKLPWDDAVTLVLTYAEIPYDKLYDEDIIEGKLPLYDWLHLHHEDFTGQYSRFYTAFHNASWYIEDRRENETMAQKLGFRKVSEMKLAVVRRIRDFTSGGGFLFAMCCGADTFDIALAADGVDISDAIYDRDPPNPNAQNLLNYKNCFAFQNFSLEPNPFAQEFSNINNSPPARPMDPQDDFFSLFQFSAKYDPIPSMLTQNHESLIKGFLGKTTAFHKEFIKPGVIIMGENKGQNEARYIHGDFGKGTWTFYSGHDPEDYQHQIGDPPTDLSLHPNSPGYRLILNNILFPAAKKKQQKT